MQQISLMNIVFFFLTFQMLVIQGGTDVTQPLHLLRTCCFPGITDFVRAARDVRELPSQVWLPNYSKGRGRLWLSSSNSPVSGMVVEEMSFVQQSWENEPTAILPRLFFFPAFLSCLLITIVHAIFKMQRHKGSPALAVWLPFKQVHKMTCALPFPSSSPHAPPH